MRGGAGVVAVEEQALVHPSDATALPEVVVEEQQVLGHALRERRLLTTTHSTVQCSPPGIWSSGHEAGRLPGLPATRPIWIPEVTAC